MAKARRRQLHPRQARNRKQWRHLNQASQSKLQRSPDAAQAWRRERSTTHWAQLRPHPQRRPPHLAPLLRPGGWTWSATALAQEAFGFYGPPRESRCALVAPPALLLLFSHWQLLQLRRQPQLRRLQPPRQLPALKMVALLLVGGCLYWASRLGHLLGWHPGRRCGLQHRAGTQMDL